MRIREIRAGARRLRYVDSTPAGPARGTLLLIHAFPLNARMWEPQLALSARGWRVVAPQLRGFDGGDDPPASSMDDYAADAVQLLDALGIERAVIGGVSMGGYATFAVLRRAAARAQAIVLADTRPQADTPEAKEGRQRMLQLLDDAGPPAVAEQMIPRLLGETTRSTRPEIVERTRALALASSKEAIAGAIRALMSRPDSTVLLGSIACPALIVAGEEDAITPPDVHREMHRALRRSELVIVPAAGHLASLEQPDVFNDALARFLEHQV